MSEQKDILVQVDHLKKYFGVKGLKGPGVQAVEDVSLFIRRGETLGLVGESGRIVYDGQTIFEGKDPWQRKSVPVREKDGSTTKREELVQVKVPRPKQVNMLPYRRKMQIIFQDPSASLDPRMTVGEIIGEALDIHKLYGSKQERTDRTQELLGQVGLNPDHTHRYPHE